MGDLTHFALVILLLSLTLLLAIGSNRVAELLRIPAPALFLILAAVASDVAPKLGGLSVVSNQRIVTVALVIILFDGGMHIGWNRMRTAAGAVAWLGVAGTAVTAGALAVVAHALLGFDWEPALLIGAALAPTDPAVVFAVLGRREISGRSGTLLEGESGANDPVGIAVMVSLLGAHGGGWSSVGGGLGHFAQQLGIGAAFGIAGGWLLVRVMRHVPLPNEALYPVQAVAFALALYGGAAALDGSGFLAVFLAGILIGDERAPYKREVEHFAGALASLGEIVAFVVLGLSIHLWSILTSDRIWIGLALAAILILIVRPLLVGVLMLPIDLTGGERWFVLLAGLKGAVPILLGTYVLAEGVHHAQEIYDVVFVVVLVSVLVQGGLVPTLARVFHVPMRVTEQRPWALGMRFQDEPRGLRQYVVAPGSPAEGSTVAQLDVGDQFWISMISRDGALVQVRGSTVLRAGDEVLALTDEAHPPDSVFTQ